ncbi:MAG: hypothetical protein SangKO_015550 [Sandaracinaceae bacterium]
MGMSGDGVLGAGWGVNGVWEAPAEHMSGVEGTRPEAVPRGRWRVSIRPQGRRATQLRVLTDG